MNFFGRRLSREKLPADGKYTLTSPAKSNDR